MKNYNDPEKFESIIKKLKDKFSSVPLDDKFQWDTVNAILMLEIKKNWTVASSNSNYQINSEHVKDFFPILSISEAFPHWRLEMKGLIHSSILSAFGITPNNEGWNQGGISYRHKIQNGYPYLQLTLESELRSLKNALHEKNQIFRGRSYYHGCN